jgi:hypothetical protein
VGTIDFSFWVGNAYLLEEANWVYLELFFSWFDNPYEGFAKFMCSHIVLAGKFQLVDDLVIPQQN